MDPIYQTLGILPTIGNAIDVYKSIRVKFKIFCHYSAEVERIRKRFGAQRDFFLNEVELVLRLALQDQDIIKDMIKDPAHNQWEANSLQEKLESVLGRNARSMTDIVNDIEESMQALRRAFQCFTPLEEEQKRVRIQPNTIRKLRKRVTITFEKKSFEEQIDRLEKSNSGLRRLREQVNQLQKPPRYTAKKSSARAGRLPLEFGTYGAIRRASKALHEALRTAWSSTRAPHLGHFVRLFLNAKAENDVQMEIAILCYGSKLQQRALLQTTLTRLQVRSRTIDSITWSSAGLLAPASEADNSQNDRRKRQRVRFSSVGSDSNISSDEELASYTSTTPTEVKVASTDNLQLTGHFCRELSRRCSAPGVICKAEGLGHIDSRMQEGFRHCFFPCSSSHCGNMVPDDVMLMDEALGQSASTRLTVVGQLQLAHRLVSAVLKFNSTPWLKEAWSVRDLAFFKQGEDLTMSLQTLHFGVELIHSKFEPRDSPSVMDVESPANLVQSFEEAQYKHGVRNITLYSLGAALLAIGRWERIDHNDIEEVRRLASRPCYLGPVYQELTQKVLDCDFGYGKDLKKPRLQQAIYEMVVLELESMIASLDISDEE
ncbi:hypothetical protein BBK36DRAFT_140979 [Trichoderma citrinoviride]|uniref:Uncharacterized protein n=1 Tax=Trichoderma citrinoviride TaxID=58853 RepID=A0A2T4B5R2_9HYPO|nr:hypothetical protein BBK36DRAFT_140979 [Trichoderma citrinoviride]PTB64676.1 hypothetical protein BBK36DRAFT_140979 [Trichoderma citrinoviride]